MAEKLFGNFYKLFSSKGEWLLLSFRFPDPIVADQILRRFIRTGVVWKRITVAEGINHSPRFFSTFRIGAIKFDIAHRDPLRYLDFFYQRFVDGYEWCSPNSPEGIHPGIVLPSSQV